MYKDEIVFLKKKMETDAQKLKILLALDSLEKLSFDELVKQSYCKIKLNGKYKYRLFRLHEARHTNIGGLTMHTKEDEFQTNITTENGKEFILNEFKSKLKNKLLSELFLV